jgi:cyanophycin synthetase
MPKLFQISHADEVLNLAQRVTAYGLEADDRVASLIHCEFTSGWRLLTTALAAGAALRLHPKHTPSWMDGLMSSEVSILLAPVVGLHGMLQRYGGHGQVLPSLRRLATTGSEVSEDLRHQIHTRLTPRLYVGYGSNEMSYLSMAGPDDWLKAPGTVGRLLPGIEMEVVDLHDRPVPAGQPGLLRFRKLHMPNGYIGDPEMTRRHFKGGWFYPGDVGTIDAEGRLILLGRADDMMICNGINIYPSEIESTLRRFPGVRDVAAVPLRHPVHQDVPVCAVALDPEAAQDANQIRAWARNLLGSAAPQIVFILKQLPRDAQGKLLRPQLRKMLAARWTKGRQTAR